jgi:hypothetical protein
MRFSATLRINVIGMHSLLCSELKIGRLEEWRIVYWMIYKLEVSERF